MLKKEVILKDGWYWPSKDMKCWPWLQREKDLPSIIASHCSNKGVAVQAGGNCGFYPKLYGGIFKSVYTFEPDNLNFYCLTLNASAENIFKQQACIGDSRQLVALTNSKKNIGCYSIIPETQGLIPTLMIDDLGLNACDLIHFDIEGWELPALRGAAATVEKYKPVIALEWLSHGERFGFKDSAIESWLADRNYTKYESIMHERIYIPS